MCTRCICLYIYINKSYAHACGYMEGTGWHQLSSMNSLQFLRWGLSMNLEHTDLLRLNGQYVLSDFTMLVWNYRSCTWILCEFGDLNSGLYTM